MGAQSMNDEPDHVAVEFERTEAAPGEVKVLKRED
jgi:hypothetical protein